MASLPPAPGLSPACPELGDLAPPLRDGLLATLRVAGSCRWAWALAITEPLPPSRVRAAGLARPSRGLRRAREACFLSGLAVAILPMAGFYAELFLGLVWRVPTPGGLPGISQGSLSVTRQPVSSQIRECGWGGEFRALQGPHLASTLRTPPNPRPAQAPMEPISSLQAGSPVQGLDVTVPLTKPHAELWAWASQKVPPLPL